MTTMPVSSRARQLQILTSLGALITATLDTMEVRKRAVQAATTLLGAEAGSLFLVDEATGELFCEVALGDKGDTVKQIRLQPGEGVAGWVAQQGKPLIVPDVAKDRRFCRAVDDLSDFITRNLACVPVTITGKTIGVLEVVNKRGAVFSRRDVGFLAALADQVAIALENARLYAENSRHMQLAIDQERRHRMEKERLVKDLHDGIGGGASNISMLAAIALRDKEPATMADALGTIGALSHELLDELRTFMNTLESRDLTWQDLAAEIRSHASSMLGPHGINFSFAVALAEPDATIGMFLYLTLLRMAKEALTNVVKHAQATQVKGMLQTSAEQCVLWISDNGLGVNNGRKCGRGLRNLSSRAAELHGTLAIVSPPGTSITLTMPLPFRYDKPEVTA